jgi:glutamate/tyrosine decarboxylase-like PLP-dependent enzyme
MHKLLQDTAVRAARYLDGLTKRSVSPSAEALERLAQLDEPLPAGTTPPAEVLALLDDLGSPATLATAGPRFFGFVIGGSLPAALAANWLAGAWDQNAGLEITSPVSAKLEDVALGWLLDVLGLPAGCGGGFVTGATVANFTALAAARHAVLLQAGWDVEANGLFGAPEITVVISAEAHGSVLKSLSILGLGRERVVRVPTDSQGRMRADSLPAVSGPTIVCIQAGNVNTGAFDPAVELCAWAHEAGAWVHVDGAFGLWAAATPRFAHLMAGYDQADSWATDAHKWLNVPYDSGIAFCREPGHIQAAMSMTGAYLVQGTAREPYQYTPELSRRARGIEVWAALRALGRNGLAEMIERNCSAAARFAQGLQEAGYQVLNDVVLNQVLVSFGSPETTDRVIAGIQLDGSCWCGGTVWQGQRAMRISVSSWATTAADVERSLKAILSAARAV